MIYNPESILTKHYKLSYKVYPGGEKYLFLFHGYGQSTDIFESFIPTVLSHYTVIAIDLFFHGDSEVLQKNKNFISIGELNQLFGEILQRYSVHTFSMLSFSIGSRFIFAIFHTYSNQIDRIALIAPDGFGNTFWFRMATSNVLCRAVFKLALTFPFLITYPARFFNGIGIINDATSNFIQKSLQSKKERERIFNTWVYFRKLKMHSAAFVNKIKAASIQLFFATGSKDELVAHHTIQKISIQLHAPYIELPFAHAKMVQAISLEELRIFLIADRK